MDEASDEQVDSTLPPEWALPELPKDLTPSLSTAEFEEIFGGSDDENDFPLSVGGLQGHMALNNVLPNPSELFSGTIPPLNLESKSLNVSTDKMEVEMDPVKDDSSTKQLTSNKEPLDDDQEPPQSVNTPVPDDSIEKTDLPPTETSGEVTNNRKSTTTVENKEDDTSNAPSEPVAVANTVSRRSARIRAKEEISTSSIVVGENVTVKSEKGEESSELDEESLVDSLLERNSESGLIPLLMILYNNNYNVCTYWTPVAVIVTYTCNHA